MAVIDGLYFTFAFIAALGCGLMAGLFFAFSVCGMKALARLPSAEGIAAMQAINVVIINPVFLVAFFGTAAACVFVIIAAMLKLHQPGAVYVLVGGAFYLFGSFMVTLLFNVPRNQALAAASPADPEASNLWAGYLSIWTFWNHVRTAAALAATASLILALRH